MNDRPQPGRRHPYYASAEANAERDDDSARPPAYAGRAGAMSPSRRHALQFLPVTLGVVAGIVLVIVATMLLSHKSDAANPPSVAPTARQICSALTTQRYGDLYRLLSHAQQAIGPSDQFAAAQRQLDAELGTVHACAYTITGQDAASATLALTLTRGSSPAASAPVRLTFEQNAWRIADYDSSLVAVPSRQLSRVLSPSNGG